jgi:hypothetical protein
VPLVALLDVPLHCSGTVGIRSIASADLVVGGMVVIGGTPALD